MIQAWRTKVLNGRCGCRRPLTTLQLNYVERAPIDGEVLLCVRCIVRLLCRATVALHGDIGERPASHDHPGHEARMREHEERIWTGQNTEQAA